MTMKDVAITTAEITILVIADVTTTTTIEIMITTMVIIEMSKVIIAELFFMKAQVMQISITLRKLPQYLPISTRGIGFAISLNINLLVQNFPNIPAPNVHCLYRTSLMQLHLKMKLAWNYQQGRNWHQPNVTTDARSLLMSRPVNLSIICHIINQIGHMVRGGLDYYPTFLDSTSPAHIHIENLRDYVVRMSDPATAPEIRNKG